LFNELSADSERTISDEIAVLNLDSIEVSLDAVRISSVDNLPSNETSTELRRKAQLRTEEKIADIKIANGFDINDEDKSKFPLELNEKIKIYHDSRSNLIDRLEQIKIDRFKLNEYNFKIVKKSIRKLEEGDELSKKEEESSKVDDDSSKVNEESSKKEEESSIFERYI
jgi:hypothetical protein